MDLDPEGALSTHEEKLGRGDRFRSPPHPSLRPFVVEYWGLARDLARMGGFTISPDCFGELICCVDDMFVVGGAGGERVKLPRCFLVGLLDGPLPIEAAGVVRCMAARLHPWSVSRLIAEDPDRPSRGWQDAGSLFGSRLASVSTLVERCDWEALTGIYDDLLMEDLGRWKPGRACMEMAAQFVGYGGLPTAIVAGERRITGRQLERRVRRVTLTSPKRLACLSRFQRARDAIWADPSIDLARLAVVAGYADQSHLTRDFRRHSGRTPGQFARDSIAKKRWLAAQDVVFVQERAVSDG